MIPVVAVPSEGFPVVLGQKAKAIPEIPTARALTQITGYRSDVNDLAAADALDQLELCAWDPAVHSLGQFMLPAKPFAWAFVYLTAPFSRHSRRGFGS